MSKDIEVAGLLRAKTRSQQVEKTWPCHMVPGLGGPPAGEKMFSL